jgi:hypothetical protein
MTPPKATQPALSEERGDWLTVWMRSGRIMEARSTRLPQEDVIKAGREIHEIAAARLTTIEAAQPLAPAPKDYAYDEIHRVYDAAIRVLSRQPKSYLGWNWVHALVDALEALTIKDDK